VIDDERSPFWSPCYAMDAPMPFEALVTTATLPFSLPMKSSPAWTFVPDDSVLRFSD
jgi:hypothetical protein